MTITAKIIETINIDCAAYRKVEDSSIACGFRVQQEDDGVWVNIRTQREVNGVLVDSIGTDARQEEFWDALVIAHARDE